MQCGNRECRTRCPVMMGRREFVTSMGASTLALKMGLFDFASSLFAQEAQPVKKPVVHAVFLRPDTDRFWMGWPGASYDIKARQADYTKVMTDAANKLGVQLEVRAQPLPDRKAVDAYLEQLKSAPPDGIIATVMCLSPGTSWPDTDHFAQNRGEIPLVVFSPMGTSFTGHLQTTRGIPKTFVAATQDFGWLATGVQMLNTIWRMKNTRICVLRGNQTVDAPLSVIGTTLHHIPLNRWPEELKKVETSDEVRAIVDYYTKEARSIVEPNPEDIINAAKTYLVAKRIMAAENCQGISMDCLSLVGARTIPCPPCIAWSKLLDEGVVGACEADWPAAISMLLTGLLCDRPGFMQDPAPNTVNNTLMGAHCTSPTKLNGFDKPHEPFVLRSHSESGLGVSPQVLWKLGQEVTIMKFQNSESIILGTGRVVANIDTPPSGGCRTSVELEVDDVADSRDIKGFHQLFIYGTLDQRFKAYCELAGIKVVHI